MVDAYVHTVTSHPDRDRLILEHIPLLKHIAGRMTFDLPGGMDRDDLYGFGMLGLIGAADSWDASRGLKFSTFAYPRIRGAILDELRRSDFLPRGRREKVRALDAELARLEQVHGAPPTPEELAEALGVDLDEVDAIMASASNALEATLDDGPGESLASMLRDPQSPDPVESAEWNELKSLLVTVIEDLPEQEKTVITLYYAEELLLREIATILDVTE
ncbi:MAG: FliA/WhiG family RNA polymerase sigma factor, partial [Planctomycetes bacterium]|nr:FliA/WhiG family RNA polymerase sigma factor [Planctomycetota bacterium]